jgi:hypothetical protein
MKQLGVPGARCRGKPAKLARLPPQAQSPEYIAHCAESRRAGRSNRWRLLAVRVTLALLVARMMEIIKVRRYRIRSRHWSRSRCHRMRSHIRWKNPLTSRTALEHVDPWLPRGKGQGIAIFGINDLAMPTRQTHPSIRSLEVPAPSPSRILCRKDSSACYQRTKTKLEIGGNDISKGISDCVPVHIQT